MKIWDPIFLFTYFLNKNKNVPLVNTPKPNLEFNLDMYNTLNLQTLLRIIFNSIIAILEVAKR
jgi:hypothetical protein